MRLFKDIRLLLWKTSLQKRRSIGRSLCEIICPLILVAGLALGFLAVPESDNAATSFHLEMQSVENVPFGVLRWQLGLTGMAFGMAPDSSDTTSLLTKLDAWYPSLQLSDAFDLSALASVMDTSNIVADWTMPKFSDSVMAFASEADLETYVRRDDYEDVTPLFAGIAVDSFAPNWEYSIRVNISETPDTSFNVNLFSRKATTDNQDTYINGGEAPDAFDKLGSVNYPGFTTIQLALDRVIIDSDATAAPIPDHAVKEHILKLLYHAGRLPASAYNGAYAAFDFATTEGAAIRSHFATYLRKNIVSAKTAPFPTPAYVSNPFYDGVTIVLSFFMNICFLLPVSGMIRGVVSEKETRVREGMKMMGLSTLALNAAWYITYAIVFFAIALGSTIITQLTFFPKSNFFLVFMLFFEFGLAATALCFLISAFFSRAKTASTLGMIIFFGSFFPMFSLDDKNSNGELLAATLSPTIGFGGGINLLASYENDGVGMTFDTVSLIPNNYSFENVLWMLCADFFIYTILGWYFYEVLPSEFGTTRPPWFPFTKAYWLGTEYGAEDAHMASAPKETDTNADPSRFEPPSASETLKAENNKAMVVKDLVKRFKTPDGVKTAVNHLSVTMYEDEIFALLGHNGAGKTTTISMLTGLISATSGDATMYGKSIRDSMLDLRQSMGVCPQHNVLWDELTVEEHLVYFAGIKGVDADKVANEVNSIIREVGLVEKADAPSGSLSGGQKRKLSVAIALIGDPKIVFLDEPTSGMDPFSRRSTWNLLKSKAKGRITVLTTHFMDEADLLGDRIGIMSDGALRCLGSPMFLKHRYGVGYSFTAVKKDGCDSSRVKSTIREFVPEAKTLSDVGREISFQLPLGAASSFPGMMGHLDEQLEALQLESYGLGVTTMEEVFIKVAQHGDRGFHENRQSKSLSTRSLQRIQQQAGYAAQNGDVTVNVAPGSRTKLGPAREPSQSLHTRATRGLFCAHLRALLEKRMWYFIRDYKSIVFQILIPIFAVLFGIWILKAASFSDWRERHLTPVDLNDATGAVRIPFINTPDNVPQSIMAGMPYVTALNQVERATAHGLLGTYFAAPAATATESEKDLQGLAEYLLDTRSTYHESRFGAYVIAGNETTGLEVSYFHNSSAFHGVPIFLSMVDSAVYAYTSGNPSASIKAFNHPLPLTQQQLARGQSVGAFFATLIICVAFAFVPAAFIVFVIKEREVSAKHQQLISGVSIPGYWLANFMYDSAVYMLAAAGALIILAAFDITEFVDDGAFGATALLFVLYGPASAGFSYFTSFLFKEHSSGQSFILMTNVFSIILVLASFVLGFIDSTKDVDDSLRWIYRFLPGYCLGEGLVVLAMRTVLKFVFPDRNNTALHWDTTGKPLLYLAMHAVLLTCAAMGVDYVLSNPSWRAKVLKDPVVPEATHDEDSDVVAEATPNPDDAVRLTNIRKVYGSHNPCTSTKPKVAVRSLSFGVRKGECFGFLGINGAGKTSTLKILSGDAIPSSGAATLLGYDIMKDQLTVRRLLGYCPQFDALLDLLTVRKHLEFYARIKGMSGDSMQAVVDAALVDMDLKEFEHRLAGTLSGGNKRKLSVAIAMIGDPAVVFLDEPSTGMDPVARRFMWEVIERIARKASVILVSHSMEECEALCNRVGILVGGRLRCVGSVQHLKNKFGQGFHCEIKLRSPKPERVAQLLAQANLTATDRVNHGNLLAVCEKLGSKERASLVRADGPGWLIYGSLFAGVPAKEFVEWFVEESMSAVIAAFMAQAFTGCQLSERHGNRMWFKIPKPEMSLGDMFATLEAAKDELQINEYSLSQTSLEQIFNSFAAKQEEETGAVHGMASAAGGHDDSGAALVGSVPAGVTVPTPLAIASPAVGMGAGVGAGAPSPGEAESKPSVLRGAAEAPTDGLSGDVVVSVASDDANDTQA